MEIEVMEDGTTEFRVIPEFLFRLLRDAPTVAGSKDPRVENRFFPVPASPELAPAVCEDWAAFVQPELQAAFLEARDVVHADLRGAEKIGGTWTVRIPLRHAEAWMHVLNQARLAIAAENDFDEQTLAADLPVQVQSDREQSLLQMHFYGMVQEWFVRFLD